MSNELSWMGSWGAKTPKPSRAWGTASGTWLALACEAEQFDLRPWIEELYEKFTHEKRAQLAEEAAADGLEVSVQYQKADGTRGVSAPERACALPAARLRHGGKDLKATQIYPVLYGNHIAELHLFLMDGPPNFIVAANVPGHGWPTFADRGETCLQQDQKGKSEATSRGPKSSSLSLACLHASKVRRRGAWCKAGLPKVRKFLVKAKAKGHMGEPWAR